MTPQISITTTIRRVTTETPAPILPLYQYGDDLQVLGGVRSCASSGCPAVMVLKDAPDMFYDLHWQMYLVAINFGMSLNAISGLMGAYKAFMNMGNDGTPHANYILRTDLSSPNPKTDKFRTCALNTHTGTETYSLMFAMANIFQAVRRRSFQQARSAMAAITETNALIVQAMDGHNPPPMKPGARRPSRVEEVNPDDYEILPQTHRHLFVDANNIKSQLGGGYKIGPFAHGIVRPWTGDSDIHTFFPLATVQSRVLSPLRNWRKVPAGAAFPSPFRR